jgi:hypothetical protein
MFIIPFIFKNSINATKINSTYHFYFNYSELLLNLFHEINLFNYSIFNSIKLYPIWFPTLYLFKPNSHFQFLTHLHLHFQLKTLNYG